MGKGDPAGPSQRSADLSEWLFKPRLLQHGVCLSVSSRVALEAFQGTGSGGPRLLATAFGAAQLLMCFHNESRKVPLWLSVSVIKRFLFASKIPSCKTKPAQQT